MEKRSINGQTLSHNQGMEKENYENNLPTKETDSGVVCLSPKDAEEYKAYKRRKKLNEINKAISDSCSSALTGEDVQRVCQRAIRLKQASVKVPLTKVSQAYYYLLGYKTKIDCVVGGDGETLAKVKAYEAKIAVRRKAKEITLLITPSLVDCCRFGEVRKEIKKVKRAVGKIPLKVRVENCASQSALSRLARLSSEVGAKYFSVSYFKGCERLKTDLFSGCGLEITDVETEEVFRLLHENGVERICSDNALEIYNSWLKEVEAECVFPSLPKVEEKEESTFPSTAKELLAETEEGYLTKTENGELKIL